MTGANPKVKPGDQVVVTGAAGFIGSAVVRALLDRNAHVVALLEPGADEQNLKGLDVERITADVRDAPAVISACDGAR
ncbi:MAG TPA: NAD-dependent epimerase/dehydratase family protein, partial [Acidimicrobiales bacterium]|nr:NAD-dependent epimerase/dehydratase family protein [Acidimicrobiales bacterium]